MPSHNSGAQAQRLFDAVAPTRRDSHESIADVPITRIPDWISSSLLREAAEEVAQALDITPGAAEGVFRHGDGEVRGVLWGMVSRSLLDRVKEEIQGCRDSEKDTGPCFPLDEDADTEDAVEEDDEVPTNPEKKPKPKVRKKRSRRSVQDRAQDVLGMLSKGRQDEVEQEFLSFLERAFPRTKYKALRTPPFMYPDDRRKVIGYVRECDERLVGCMRWLSLRFCNFVSNGQLLAKADDFEDMAGEGYMQLWSQFLRVWGDKGDPASGEWGPEWDEDVIRLEYGSKDTLIRHMAQRRGISQRVEADRRSVSIYFQLRRRILERHGRSVGDPLTLADGIQTAARAYAAYRRGRMCTCMYQGGPIRMQVPPIADVIKVWLDGEAAATNPGWRSRSLDAPLDPSNESASLAAMLENQQNAREFSSDERDFADRTMTHLQDRANPVAYAYYYHCVSGITPRDHWMSPDEFVEHHELQWWELTVIRADLERILYAWFAKHDMLMDVSQLVRGLSPDQRGLFGGAEVIGDSRHLPLTDDTKSDGVWQDAVDLEEMPDEDELEQRLTVAGRARLLGFILRYHEWTIRQVVGWVAEALDAEGWTDSAVEAACAQLMDGKRTADVIGEKEVRKRVSALMRDRMRDTEAESRGTIEALDIWWTSAYANAKQDLAAGAMLSNILNPSPEDEERITRHAVSIAWAWSRSWLQVNARAEPDSYSDDETPEAEVYDDGEHDLDDDLRRELAGSGYWDEGESFGMSVVEMPAVPPTSSQWS